MSVKSLASLLILLSVSTFIVTPAFADAATTTPSPDKKEAPKEKTIPKDVKSDKPAKKESSTVHHETKQTTKAVRKFKHNDDKTDSKGNTTSGTKQ